MGSTLNMTSKIICLNAIDFLGFSRSPFWIGYFKAKSISDISLVRESTKIVYDYFQEDWNEFFLLGSLSHTEESDESIQERFSNTIPHDYLKHYLEVYHAAIKSKFIYTWNDTFEKFYDNEDYPSIPVNMITLNFNHETFLDFCELLMVFCFSPVIGQQCFLINPRLKIALYPHDDTGFGIISLDENRVIAEDFLSFCAEFEGFEVHMETEC